jgi:hypothetical protein
VYKEQLKHHHHHSEHGRDLGLKTCSFEAQGVPGPSILQLKHKSRKEGNEKKKEMKKSS